MIAVGLIGYGYWGQKIARHLGRFTLKSICDTSLDRLQEAQRDFKGVQVTPSIAQVLDDPKIQAVLIITPVNTHYALAKQALLANKHVFIEKPLGACLAQAKELYALAKQQQKILHCDLTFIYSAPIRWIQKNLGMLGDVLSITSRRLGGICREDTNILYDLGLHDLSILSFFYPNALCVATNPTLHQASHPDHPTPTSTCLNFYLPTPKQTPISIYLSWLSPFKVRDMLIMGTQNTLYYNDNAPNPIALYPTTLNPQQTPPHHPPLSPSSALLNCLESFYEGILNTTPCPQQERIILDALGFLEKIEGVCAH
ncbi:predicted dehydrogenase or related protein [Helicobacter bizzozeronii CIII-1]|uniref:Predicted dehydrogenase or related protein n=1 Tax=Helicobacter bizzozeronii (strain CIII-1) TaxID=1002804 RepID=F8KSN5_HELBC|nr:Gfo/Idh/MocA family oxidoreductase [Helicobacter bizzozeronii]CCB79810.1 predicted dehydrogenase or related protein [Helicobacter bizzozeronii CIII-1]